MKFKIGQTVSSETILAAIVGYWEQEHVYRVSVISDSSGKEKPGQSLVFAEDQLQAAKTLQDSPWEIGGFYFIRTATYHVTGRLTAIYSNELVLDDAAWIADSGRFNEALRTSSFSEVEPFCNPVIVSRGGIIDATTIDKLPREVK